MYETYFGFREKPYNLTPDPKFLFLSNRHSEALAHLEFGRRERGGFAVITGEVGTGKTTLARYFLSRLGETTATAVVLYPALSAVELLRSILDDLRAPSTGATLKELVDALHRFLLDARSHGREVVLLIDEAQDLSPEVLEQIRLISNLETDTEKLIQIVLLGQTELNELLARRELRQLAQRVSARYHLGPLSRSETEEYVRHRLKIADGEGKVVFTPPAVATVHRVSGGVPRLINLTCDRALLAGYVQGTRTIDASHVRLAARELGLRSAAPRLSRPALVTCSALILAVIPATVWWIAARSSPDTVVSPPPPSPLLDPAPLAGRLETVLLSLPREASLQGSVAAVQSLWDGKPCERTLLRTHLEQLRRLDLPVVLEMFHPTRRDTCYLALLRLQKDRAEVSSGGTAFDVSANDLDRWWTRQAVVLWRDFDVIVGGDAGQTDAWARERLARLGYLRAGSDLDSAVVRFQRDAQLAADGVIGSRTLMMLYARGGYPRPRLSGGSP